MTLFEKSERIGGLLRYGIPDFKMEKHLIDRRVEQMAAEGVEFRTGVEIGADLPVEALLAELDAVVLSGGAEWPRDLEVEGRELDGIHYAMDYLVQQNKRVHGAPEDRAAPSGTISARGKHVVVIGGGDTGADCIGTAPARARPRSPRSRSCRSRRSGRTRRCPGRTGRTSCAPRPRTWKAAPVTGRC